MAQKNKSKMVNGHEKARINGSTLANDVPRETEDILKHISELSQVSGPKSSPKFVPLDGPSRADQERIRQQRKFPPPRNVRNLKLFDDDLNVEDKDDVTDKSEVVFDESEIRASLTTMNGGRGSDRYLRDRWTHKEYQKAKIPIAMAEKKEEKTEEKKESPTKNKRDAFSRNIGMRSIMQSKERKAEEKEEDTKIQDVENVGATNCGFPFVQDPLDPDFASRKVCGVANKDDFLVEHVGKIVKVTPRQFIVENEAEANYEFSRKKK